MRSKAVREGKENVPMGCLKAPDAGLRHGLCHGWLLLPQQLPSWV